MAKSKLPIFERQSADGRLLGYQVKIRKAGFPVVSRQFDKKKDAERFAISTLDEMARGLWIDRREIETTTLGEALDRYDREIGPTKKRPDGVTAYVRRWKQTALSGRFVATLRPLDFAQYRDERLAQGLSGNAIRLELGLVRHLYTIGIKEWGWPCANPVQAIRMPKCAAGRDRRLDPKPDSNGKTEEDRLLEGCRAGKSRHLEAIVRLALETAMRQGELISMTWGNVDQERRTVFLPDTKTGATRTVPLSSEAVAIIQSLPRSIAEGRDSRVFSINTMAVVHAFQRACERAGIVGLHFHDLRHEAVSRLFEKGLDMMEVSAISGHKSLSMLKRYTHLRAEDLALKLG